ncbi:MAG: FAD-dependent oxidoreductase [Hydrogenophilaceae bacterium]|nr:FAD-dependent oxidoreductase [Hydrogenophilaceae bacterium]
MRNPGKQMDVGIIGAGWAGLATAIELTLSGCKVTIYEAAKSIGGRARRIESGSMASQLPVLDNGQHLLIGAYTETQRLIEIVSPGMSAGGFLRVPLTLDYPDGILLKAFKLPAPLHLAAGILFANGFSLAEKLAAIGFIRHLQSQAFKPEAPASVAEAIANQPEKIRRYLWEPLCVAALNTPANQASYKVFARVLKDALTGSRYASDFMIPVCDLSGLFPEPASDWLKERGAIINTQQRIRTIKPGPNGWKTDCEVGEACHDVLVIATSAPQASSLLSKFPECAQIVSQIEALRYQPIVTVYVQYPVRLDLRTPLTGWIDPVPFFVFDLEATHRRKGFIAAVTSAEGPHLDWSDNRWLNEIHDRIEQSQGSLPRPRFIKRIAEKRATFSCTPDVVRPEQTTPCKNLFLVGDYVEGPYPSTLEGAVRSGVQCAKLVTQLS